MPSTNEIARSLKLRRPGQAQAPTPAVHHEGPSTDDEPLADRVHRQLTTGRIDEDRLMPSVEKRTRDIHKKLDRMAAGGGWGVFASNAAWSVQNGKAPVRRNAELSLLNEAARWRRDMQRYAPERLDEFDRLLRDALENPKEAQHPDKQGR